MLDQRKKILLSLVVLATLVVSITMTAGTMRWITVGHAQQTLTNSVSAKDFYPPAGADPWGTAFDSKGRVWLALPGCDPTPYCNNSTPPGKIAVFDPSANGWVGSYQLPSGYGQPLFLAFDQQGILWFPMPMTNTLGMFNPVSKTFREWSVPTAGSGPWGVAVDSKGHVWFTEHYANKIGSFDPATQSFKEVATPATNSIPYGITVDGSDNVWFTENSSSVALVGEYTPSNQLKEYKIRTGSTSGVTPHLITIDPTGNIWWSEGWVAAIGELKIGLAQAGTNTGVTEYFYKPVCSNCGAHTSGISADSYGNIWFDDSLQSIFGSFPDNGSGTFTMYNTPTSNSHPHDGMHVDGQNRVWFDEEFANKLAFAVQPASSTPTPSPTTGPSPTPSPTMGPSPTPSPTMPTPTPVPGKTLAQDTFQRATQTYWGTASDGQAWGGDANSSGAFSISGNAGRVSNGGGNSYSAILGPTATNAEAVVSGSLSSFNNANIGAVLRWTDGNNWYKAYISGTSLVLQKKVSGATTILTSTPFTAQAGTSYTIRFQVTGKTLNARVWATGSTEPSSWMVTASDSSLSAGYCGVRVLTQSGTSATLTSFQATSL